MQAAEATKVWKAAAASKDDAAARQVSGYISYADTDGTVLGVQLVAAGRLTMTACARQNSCTSFTREADATSQQISPAGLE
jgi:hypothetical protein